jgi:hypothetical protein
MVERAIRRILHREKHMERGKKSCKAKVQTVAWAGYLQHVKQI